MMLWLQFAACLALILFSGTRLSVYGDVIAEKTGMGRTWIGVVLIASVTSLPELVTGISSVTLYDLPDIAAGDVLGSCMFNLLILALLDVGEKEGPLSSRASQGQVLTAAAGILLLGVAVISLSAAPAMPAVGWIGVYSFVFAALYLGSMRLVFRFEKKRIAEFLHEVTEKPRYSHLSSSGVWRRFAAHAVVIVAAATYLPRVADGIAVATGLGGTFVGSFLVALSTSLPEVVVSRAALRIGAVDMAMGNILGSNLFNMFILALDDVCYRKGPLLSYISNTHAITASAAMTMTAILMIGLVYRSGKRIGMFAWDSLGIAITYALTALLLFVLR